MTVECLVRVVVGTAFTEVAAMVVRHLSDVRVLTRRLQCTGASFWGDVPT